RSLATLYVEGPVAITDHPEDVTACAGGVATFRASATSGNGQLAYTWEESVDNGTTWQVVGSNEVYVKSALVAGHDGNRYRVRVGTGACQEIISEEAVLHVEGPVGITEPLQGQTVCQ